METVLHGRLPGSPPTAQLSLLVSAMGGQACSLESSSFLLGERRGTEWQTLPSGQPALPGQLSPSPGAQSLKPPCLTDAWPMPSGDC